MIDNASETDSVKAQLAKEYKQKIEGELKEKCRDVLVGAT